MNENKKRIQREALKAWADNNFKGAIEMVTGSGKTRIGVIAAFEFIKRSLENPEMVGISSDGGGPYAHYCEDSLIVCYTETLRDNEWPNEIEKWGYGNYKGLADILCIQSAYKFSGRHYNTLVIDEADTVLSPKYLWLLKNNTFDRILLLTAEFTEAQKKLLDKLGIPLVYQCGYEKALENQLISPFTVYNVAVELNQKERVLYNKYQEQIETYTELLQDKLAGFYWKEAVMELVPKAEVYNTAKDYIGMVQKKYKNVSYKPSGYWDCIKYQSLITQRKQLIYNSESKLEAVVDICNNIIKDKCILFGESIAFCERMRQNLDTKQRRCYIYHSELGDKQKRNELELFRKSKKGILSSAKALNRGINVPDCSFGVISSGTSSSRDFIQRLGREVRLSDDPNKHAILIQCYLKDTQEFWWVKNRCEKLETKWIELEELKELI